MLCHRNPCNTQGSGSSTLFLEGEIDSSKLIDQNRDAKACTQRRRVEMMFVDG